MIKAIWAKAKNFLRQGLKPQAISILTVSRDPHYGPLAKETWQPAIALLIPDKRGQISPCLVTSDGRPLRDAQQPVIHDDVAVVTSRSGVQLRQTGASSNKHDFC